MKFVIDVNNQRVRKAMLSLGINSEELLKKEFEDFEDKSVSEDIQNLRFTFFSRKQQELVRQLKQNIKETILKALEKQKKSPNNKSQKISEIFECTECEDELEKIRKEHKKKISVTLNSIQEKINENKAIENKLKLGESIRQKIHSSLLKKRDKLQAYKEKQIENYEKIKKSQQKIENSTRNCYSITPKKLGGTRHLKSIFWNTNYEPEEDSETEIAEKIEKYHEKMKKSQSKYDETLDTKRQKASKLIQKAENTLKLKQNLQESSQNTQILKIFSKMKAAEDRRIQHFQQKLENVQNKQKINLEKRDKATSKFKEIEKIDKNKAEAIEKRLEIVEKILEQKHNNWNKELEIKHEFQRLKDEEALINAERKKRIL